MKKVSKSLFIIPFILLLFACGKKTNEANKTNKTTKDSITTKDTSKYYNVSFFNYDNTLLKTISVKEGKKPVYEGDNPIKGANLGYEYDFIGWGPSLTETYSDTNYFAQYGDLKVKKEMQNFIFQSSKDTCIINGIKDNTVTNIVVPDYVTFIVGGAFNNCSLLKSITLPFVGGEEYTETDTTQYPFGYIFGTNSYEGSKSTRQSFIGNGDIYNPSSQEFYIPTLLKEVVITGSSYIQYGAFYSCSNLTSITIPNSVTSIGKSAFYSCLSLTNITIPDSVTVISDYAFFKCSNLGKITMSNSINDIGISTFEGYIGISAFQGCSSLKAITLPNSVVKIGSFAFQGCSNLASITIPNGVTMIGQETFSSCSSLTSIVLPDSATFIGIGAFQYCSNITNITIPNGVTAIDNEAFRYCSSLKEITMPKSLNGIGLAAFSGCSSLTSIFYKGDGHTWSNIYITNPNAELRSATVYYYSENEPTGTGNYWHYVDDEVVIWE